MHYNIVIAASEEGVIPRYVLKLKPTIMQIVICIEMLLHAKHVSKENTERTAEERDTQVASIARRMNLKKLLNDCTMSAKIKIINHYFSKVSILYLRKLLTGNLLYTKILLVFCMANSSCVNNSDSDHHNRKRFDDSTYIMERIRSGVNAKFIKELNEKEIDNLLAVLPHIKKSELPKGMIIPPSLPDNFYTIKLLHSDRQGKSVSLLSFTENGNLIFGSKIDTNYKHLLSEFVYSLMN